MLDQLKMLVEEYAEATIVNNPAVPEQHKTAAVKDVSEQIVYGLKIQAKSGNIEGLSALFQGSAKSSLVSDPLIKQLISSVATSLALKFGLTSFASHQIASSLLPNVINDFTTLKDFNLQETLESLEGDVKVPELAERFNR